MQRSKALACGLGLVAILGCDVGSRTARTNEEEEYLGAVTLAHQSQLPHCDAGHRGVVYYVREAAKLYYCDGSKNRELDLPGSDGKDGKSWLVVVAPATAKACPTGGAVIQVGPDANGDGVLDAVTSSAVVCNGLQGPPGKDGTDGSDGADGSDGQDGEDGDTSLIETRPEPAGDHCALGGLLVLTGLDSDGDGTLDEAEVSDRQYLCAPESETGQGGSSAGAGGNTGGGIAGAAGGGAAGAAGSSTGMAGGSSCIPLTCDDHWGECGVLDDGCGHPLSCDPCFQFCQQNGYVNGYCGGTSCYCLIPI